MGHFSFSWRRSSLHAPLPREGAFPGRAKSWTVFSKICNSRYESPWISRLVAWEPAISPGNENRQTCSLSFSLSLSGSLVFVLLSRALLPEIPRFQRGDAPTWHRISPSLLSYSFVKIPDIAPPADSRIIVTIDSERYIKHLMPSGDSWLTRIYRERFKVPA